MKIYATNSTEVDSIEILLSHQELKCMISALEKFENEVNLFKNKNKNNKNLGFTHLHLKDCGLIDKNNDSDIVFYLNLNE